MQEESIARGRAEGLAKGIKETRLNTARKKLKPCMTIEEISKITGLNKEEALQLTISGDILMLIVNYFIPPSKTTSSEYTAGQTRSWDIARTIYL